MNFVRFCQLICNPHGNLAVDLIEMAKSSPMEKMINAMSTMTPAIEHLNLLSTQLDQLYRSMKLERQVIAEWEEGQEFSILGVLELFSGDLQGHVEQIISNSIVTNPETNLSSLRKLNVFEIDYFATWYFVNLNTYPQVKQYIEQLDHLRLLMIEHFVMQMPVTV